MNDKISQLRSRLRFTSPEFQNVVNADLIDLKWKTFQMLVVGLFQLCDTVKEEYERLESMLERRRKELSVMRSAGLSRQERNEAEHSYRTSVLQCVLEGLIHLKWPPALAAFSNPLKDLMEDNTTKLDVIEYLVNILNPVHSRGSNINCSGLDDSLSAAYNPSGLKPSSAPRASSRNLSPHSSFQTDDSAQSTQRRRHGRAIEVVNTPNICKSRPNSAIISPLSTVPSKNVNESKDMRSPIYREHSFSVELNEGEKQSRGLASNVESLQAALQVSIFGLSLYLSFLKVVIGVAASKRTATAALEVSTGICCS